MPHGLSLKHLKICIMLLSSPWIKEVGGVAFWCGLFSVPRRGCMAGETSLSRIHSLSMWVSQEGSHSALCFTCWEKGTLDTEDPQVEARGEGSVGLGETGEGAQEVIK